MEVEPRNEEEGQYDEFEGVCSSDGDKDVPAEDDQPGTKEENENDKDEGIFSRDEGEDVKARNEKGGNSSSESKGKVEDGIESQETGQPIDQEHSGSKVRLKSVCPVPGCRKKAFHLPRHLVQVYQRSHSRSRAALTNLNLRKQYTFKNQQNAEAGNRKRKHDRTEATKTYKDYHKNRICPMAGCLACVKRLPTQLKNVHKLNPSSNVYKSLLKKALPKGKRPYSAQLIEKRVAGETLTEFEEAFLERKREVTLEEFPEVEMQDSDKSVSDNAEVNEEAEDQDDTDPVLILKFAEWLQAPDGGKKDIKTVKQHASQDKRILWVIDTDKTVESLLDLTLLKEKFVKYAEGKYVPETIKSYFTSLQHFYSSLLSEKPNEIAASSVLVTQLREKVKRWSASYKR